MAQSHESNVAQTYLSLRLAMVLLVALLFLSVASIAVTTGCLQRSISAYYYTPVRPIFVATLAAIGASLIIYQGNTDTENLLLDFCGFLAFIVALVPTSVDLTCAPTNVPTAEEISAATRNNVFAVFLMGTVSALVAWRVKRALEVRDGFSRSAKASLIVSVIFLVAGAIFFLVWPHIFQEVGHTGAAVAMFAGIIAVVCANARGFARAKGTSIRMAQVPANRYSIVAAAMGVTLLSIPLAAWLLDNFDHWIFVIEAALLIEFAIFWAIQTQELEGKVTR